MNQPLVSVIITTYNRFDFLCRAINSVLAQTYKNIEIIVIDDFSTDGTKEKIENYSSLVKYVRNEENIGLPASRNVGILASAGDYISFLDDDDEILPEKIEKQINIFLTEQDVDVVYCGSIKKNKNFILENPASLKGNIYPQVLGSCPNAIHTLLVKRKCFDLIGLFDEECCFDYVAENLVIYYIHGCQMSVQLKLKITGREMILKKHRIDFEKNNEYLYWYLRKLASRYALLGDYVMFRKYIAEAIYLNAFSLGAYAHVFLAFTCRPLHRKFICRFGVTTVGDVLLV